MSADPNMRISATDALNHPWFKLANKGELKGKDLGDAL